MATACAARRCWRVMWLPASVATWGSAIRGGALDLSTRQARAGGRVASLVSSEEAFAVLFEDGSVSSWGRSHAGGNPPASVRSATSATPYAFAAVHEDGSVSEWGS
eukprot:1996626-Prymnesium_polylepis.1